MLQIDLTFEHLRQKALSVIVDALAMAGDDSRDDPGVIHDLRVTVKRLRAWWRLLRTMLPDRHWQVADHRVRQIGKLLAPARDRYVEAHTLDQLASLGQAGNKTRKPVAVLQSQWESVIQQAPQTQCIPDWPQITTLFQAKYEHWQVLDFTTFAHDQQSAMLITQLKRTYRKARVLYRAVITEPAESTCHLYRKWVKHLMYQLELPADVSDEPAAWQSKLRNRLHTLAGHLGDHHDFAVLAGELRDRADVLDEKAVNRVLKLIRQEQKQLLKQVSRKSKQVFSEKPGVWVKMLNQ